MARKVRLYAFKNICPELLKVMGTELLWPVADWQTEYVVMFSLKPCFGISGNSIVYIFLTSLLLTSCFNTSQKNNLAWNMNKQLRKPPHSLCLKGSVPQKGVIIIKAQKARTPPSFTAKRHACLYPWKFTLYTHTWQLAVFLPGRRFREHIHVWRYKIFPLMSTTA